VKTMTEQELNAMRRSGKMLAAILKTVNKAVKPGVTTGELADIAERELEKLGGQPVFKGYGGGRGIQPFPSAICISVNDEIVHGIPGRRELKAGDIVGLDFGVNIDGMITDSAITVPVGKVKPEVQRLLAATKQALELGIAQVRPGARVGDISAAVQARLDQDQLGIVEELAGHGVGHSLHEEPWIPNFGTRGRGPVLREGMTIAIEPMATLGKKDVLWGTDGWTIKALDGSYGAHFEHTVLITADGAEILT
jgi:methionyl aminopeptidase